MIEDLVQFLRNRLDEVEARARILPTGPWMWRHFDDPESDALVGPGGTVLASNDAEGYQSWIERDDAFDAYLQDIQPERALAEVEAKRQLLAIVLAEPHLRIEEDNWYSCSAATDDDGELRCLDETRVGKPCDCGRDNRVARQLRLLALPYADHPDYRAEWRP